MYLLVEDDGMLQTVRARWSSARSIGAIGVSD